MAKKNTYIVECWDKTRQSFVAFSLREWCEANNMVYMTVVSRIHRSKDVKEEMGIYFFKESDAILRNFYGRQGRYIDPSVPPKHRAENKLTPSKRTKADGRSRNFAARREAR